MKQNTIETLVGFIVLLVALGFFIFAYNTSNVAKVRDGYILAAKFQDVDGISEGVDIKLAGIKIGYVDSVSLDPVSYCAEVKLYIDKDIAIPEDSRISVTTSGLLGGRYLRITPGASDTNLANAGKIKFTQSSLNIEDLIGKLMYSLTKQ